MLHARFYVKEMMSLVESSKEQGHLLMPNSYPERYQNAAIHVRLAMNYGMTTHPAFEQCEGYVKCYRLKPGYSASTALHKLLYQYEMVVDCGLVQLLAYYLSILKAMQNKYGEIEGAKRFDAFFGDKERDIPLNRRLVLSPEGPLMGTHRMPMIPRSKQALPMQPLSFLFKLIESKDKSDLLQKVNIGSMLMFAGDPDYLIVHPLGSDGGHNCVVSSVQPLKVKTFNLDDKELTEHDLIENHVVAYRKCPSDESNFVSQGQNRFFQHRKPEADRKNMQGFATYFVEFAEERLEFLLSADIKKFDEAYQRHVTLERLKTASMGQESITMIDAAFERLNIKRSTVIEQEAVSALQPTGPLITPQAELAKKSGEIKQIVAAPKLNTSQNEFGFRRGFLNG